MKCLYCKCEVSNESPVGVCRRCGIKVWGEKMFNAIVSGMSEEKEKGNMELGRVSETVGARHENKIERTMKVSEELSEELEEFEESQSKMRNDLLSAESIENELTVL